MEAIYPNACVDSLFKFLIIINIIYIVKMSNQ